MAESYDRPAPKVKINRDRVKIPAGPPVRYGHLDRRTGQILRSERGEEQAAVDYRMRQAVRNRKGAHWDDAAHPGLVSCRKCLRHGADCRGDE